MGKLVPPDSTKFLACSFRMEFHSLLRVVQKLGESIWVCVDLELTCNVSFVINWREVFIEGDEFGLDFFQGVCVVLDCLVGSLLQMYSVWLFGWGDLGLH